MSAKKIVGAVLVASFAAIFALKYQAIYNEYISPPINYLRSQNAIADTIKFSISPENFQKLKNKRDEAIQNGLLVRSNDDYVAASINLNEQEFNAQIRLKGDELDHLQGDFWSLKVNLKKKARLDGMRKFAIRSPKTRSYIHE
ncbi:MAG: hypothetical protein HRT71_15805 [Flavobacteriales bacterium]|nr:hypothetical protein [Flavobacteriales bacterium]